MRAFASPPPFPVEQRPIVYRPVGALSRSSLAALEPALFAAIATILDDHRDEKGLIHAPSYAAGARLVRDLAARAPAHARRLIWVESTEADRKSTRLNSSHLVISYAVFCLKKKTNTTRSPTSTWRL